MSNGVAATADVRIILLSEIPGAVNVHASAPANDKQGVDWWVELSSARHLAVDAKVREQDWAATHPGEDDLALETWSVVEQNIPGWTLDATKRCDYILWLWKQTGRFCLVPFPMLCKVFAANRVAWTSRYRTARQHTPRSNGGYHSECVFVPRRELWAAIYRQYGGDLVVGKEAA